MTAEGTCFGSRRCEKISENCLYVDEYDPLVICKCHQKNTASSAHSSKNGRIKRETGEAYTAAIVRPCRVLRTDDNIGKRKVCDDIILVRKAKYSTDNRIETLEDNTCAGVRKLCDALSA